MREQNGESNEKMEPGTTGLQDDRDNFFGLKWRRGVTVSFRTKIGKHVIEFGVYSGGSVGTTEYFTEIDGKEDWDEKTENDVKMLMGLEDEDEPINNILHMEIAPSINIMKPWD